MTTKTIIYNLLSYALLDIRSAAQNSIPNASVATLANVFHNVPMHLNKIDIEGGDYDEILKDIRNRAKKLSVKAG